MTVTLWQREDRGLRFPRLHTALALLPTRDEGGPIRAFASMIRGRSIKPHTVALVAMRLESP